MKGFYLNYCFIILACRNKRELFSLFEIAWIQSHLHFHRNTNKTMTIKLTYITQILPSYFDQQYSTWHCRQDQTQVSGIAFLLKQVYVAPLVSFIHWHLQASSNTKWWNIIGLQILNQNWWIRKNYTQKLLFLEESGISNHVYSHAKCTAQAHRLY